MVQKIDYRAHIIMLRYTLDQELKAVECLRKRCLSRIDCLGVMTLFIWISLPIQLFITKQLFPLAWIQASWSIIFLVALLTTGLYYYEAEDKIEDLSKAVRLSEDVAQLRVRPVKADYLQIEQTLKYAQSKGTWRFRIFNAIRRV